MSLGFESFVDALVWSNARAVVLVVLVVGVLALSRTRAGGFRHTVWMTALAGCLLLPLMNAVVPTVPIPILPAAASEPAPLASPLANAGGVIAAQGGLLLESGSPLENGSSWLTLPLTILSRTFIVFYALGAVAVLAWFILGVLRLSKLARTMSPCACPERMALKDELCR